ncbi:hypothetical protein PHLGIDRAFT_377561 [Phlebiopsis gigantea 11061_1 CR5-6]|uniref:ABM domain-containing protein n=1 Tax=Phlebiopsis gigantea (strain 11061_1 CR5-6) TaxID=745531 RepID=A0A0C3SC19_PHLG1|nr:hypothetical protein PHLGIDRAFT_377561 [Phlebiopsis gigantea 11061_1 CR5-6]
MASSYPPVEILKFSVSDLYKEDPAILNDFLDGVAKTPGVADVWHGPEIQDDSYYYVVTAWAPGAHTDSAYTGLKNALTPACKEFVFAYPTHFGSVNVAAALGAPVTEIAVVNVKEDVTLTRFHEATNDLIAKMALNLPNEVVPGGHGSVENEPRKFVICMGWQSVERFYGEIHATPVVLEAVTTLRGLLNFDLRHAKMTKYTTN